MADRKITELAALSAPTGKDLLYVVDDPSGTPVSKKVSLHDMFGSVPANTSITGTATVSGNTSLSGAKTTVAAITQRLFSAELMGREQSSGIKITCM